LGLGHRSLDGALQNLQAAAARLKAAKASLILTRDQLNYMTLRRILTV
jgi:hypothetical protein